MPFEEDDADLDQVQMNSGLKNFSTKKSVVSQAAAEKKRMQESFDKKVESHQTSDSQLAVEVNEMTVKFQEVMSDKTLRANKNSFSTDIETQFLKKLLNLAEVINNDEDQSESKGSLILCALLLKNCMYSRDRVNQLEYEISELKKSIAK